MQIEKIEATGHQNVLSKHKKTIEFTKESHLTPKGDCIVCVNANKSIKDISEDFKTQLKKNAKVICKISTKNYEDEITGQGHKDLTFTHPTDIVLRKSDFICSRTLLIRCNKAAFDLKKELIQELKKDEKV